jgi:uncharacterized protein YqgV (UPF0045/DUF77 family)
MQASIEISLYPLAQSQYKEQIWAFINNLNTVEGLKLVTNGMSTQVFGDYDLVVSTVMAEVKKVHQQIDAAIFIIKLINSDRSTFE